MDRVVEINAEYELEMNTSKANLQIIGQEEISGVHPTVNQCKIEQVPQYNYLGTIINEKSARNKMSN